MLSSRRISASRWRLSISMRISSRIASSVRRSGSYFSEVRYWSASAPLCSFAAASLLVISAAAAVAVTVAAVAAAASDACVLPPITFVTSPAFVLPLCRFPTCSDCMLFRVPALPASCTEPVLELLSTCLSRFEL